MDLYGYVKFKICESIPMIYIRTIITKIYLVNIVFSIAQRCKKIT